MRLCANVGKARPLLVTIHLVIACHSCLTQGHARRATIALRHLARGALQPLVQGRIVFPAGFCPMVFPVCRISLRCCGTIFT